MIPPYSHAMILRIQVSVGVTPVLPQENRQMQPAVLSTTSQMVFKAASTSAAIKQESADKFLEFIIWRCAELFLHINMTFDTLSRFLLQSQQPPLFLSAFPVYACRTSPKTVDRPCSQRSSLQALRTIEAIRLSFAKTPPWIFAYSESFTGKLS